MSTSTTGAKSQRIPQADSSAASDSPILRASSSDPARPTARSGGQTVQGSPRRATRPPSWSTPTRSGSSWPASRAADCISRTRSATCSGRVDVAGEEDHAPGAVVTDELPQVGGHGVALEADHDPLARLAEGLAHCVPQPPSRFRAASLTFLPSAGLPRAWRAARAAFITFPMSLGVAAPVSATAFSTAAATSSSEASWGR